MSCYHPLFATENGLTIEGKKNIKIWSQAAVVSWEEQTGKDFMQRSDFIKLPCGKCVGCRMEYSRQWANRCMLELQYHESSYFVTLTYADRSLPLAVDPETGEVNGLATLKKRDFQLFMKRLRKRFPDQKLRFFAAGEYGSKYMRPHYHAIIFGLKLDDLKPYKRSEEGFQYFTSDTLNRVWCDAYGQIGYVVVAPVTWQTCAYTARYVMKKLNGKEAKFYSDFHLQPEFSLMSRKPGIAYQWYKDHPDCMLKDFINLSTEEKGLKFKPPRYYDHLFDLEDPPAAADRKAKMQEVAKIALRNKISSSSLPYLKQLEIDEAAFKDKNRKKLSRTKI